MQHSLACFISLWHLLLTIFHRCKTLHKNTIATLYTIHTTAVSLYYYSIKCTLASIVSKSFFHQKGFVTWISKGKESLLHSRLQ